MKPGTALWQISGGLDILCDYNSAGMTRKHNKFKTELFQEKTTRRAK